MGKGGKTTAKEESKPPSTTKKTKKEPSAKKKTPAKEKTPATTPAAAASQQPAIEGQDKKKRNSNPGVRIQGGRVYDSENGTTCHQCRQKTIEVKAKCTTCTLYFCPRCLENRYSEKVDESNALGNWSCPRCRKECNCSNCRKKAGLQATGILANVAKTAGFSSVSDLLQRNPNAKAIHHKTKTDTTGGETPSGHLASSSKPSDTNKKKKASNGSQAGKDVILVDDSTLGERSAVFPDIRPLVVTMGDVTSAPGGGIKRGRAPTWLSSLTDDDDVPGDVDQHELAAVLEFIAVFCYPPPPKLANNDGTTTTDGAGAAGGKKAAADTDKKPSPVAMNRLPPLSALAHELLQQPLSSSTTTTTTTTTTTNTATKKSSNKNDNNKLLCPIAADSPCARIHCALLQVVRQAWAVQGSVGNPAWQRLMEAYYAAHQMDGKTATFTRQYHGPPAIAGELFIKPPIVGTSDADAGDKEATVSLTNDDDDDDDDGEEEDDQVKKTTTTAPSNNTLVLPSQNAIQYPTGGYWGVPPGIRVSMLSSLIHDCLDTWPMREYIESTMVGGGGGAGGGSGTMMTVEEKERKNELADARKEARVAAAAQRDKELAMLIAQIDAKALTLEEQRELMEKARMKAEQAAEEVTAAALAKVSALTVVSASRTFHHPPTVRAPCLGVDADGRRYVQLQCSTVLGSAAPDSDAVLVIESTDKEEKDAKSIVLGTVGDLKQLVTALHPTGKREGPLRHALLTAYKMKDPVLSSMRKQKTDDSEKKKEEEDAEVAAGNKTAAAAAAAAGKKEATTPKSTKTTSKAARGEPQPTPNTTATGNNSNKKRKQSATPASSKKSRGQNKKGGAADVQEQQQELPLKVDDALTGVAN